MKDLTLYLRHKRLDEGKTIQDMAKLIGTSSSAYSYKERGITQFKLDELQKICFELKISNTDISDIFLPSKSTKRKN